MFRRVKCFFLSKRGINTVEIVVILAVILGIALIFRNEIKAFVGTIINSIFHSNVDWGIESPPPVKTP